MPGARRRQVLNDVSQLVCGRRRIARLMTRAREEYAMYEDYYGFVEKPFSLTPDPKYLYRSESHAQAFELLQYGIRRREGFVVVTGDIGTGKTTLCRAVLDQLDRKTFTALVLNPFIAEDDLLRLILQDFGVVSRDEMKRGRLAGVSRQELIETLNDFLLSLLPLRATALLIIDEAQNLPRPVLEHIRMLSNLETDKEKLLQIVLVGQLNLKDVLRSPELRQLDQRVSIRYNLKPLNGEETAAYVAHRLTIAGGGSAVSFTPKALQAVHRITAGIPRLINLALRPRAARRLLGTGPAGHAGDGPPGAASLDLAAPRSSMLALAARRRRRGSSEACARAASTACDVRRAASLRRSRPARTANAASRDSHAPDRLSQLFDALKRNRRASPPPEHVERTARADAVLATLGYRKKSGPRRPSGRLLGVCGLAVALVVAWAQWPVKRLAQRRQPLPGGSRLHRQRRLSAIPAPALPATTAGSSPRHRRR